jgi:hypothetical protein
VGATGIEENEKEEDIGNSDFSIVAEENGILTL